MYPTTPATTSNYNYNYYYAVASSQLLPLRVPLIATTIARAYYTSTTAYCVITITTTALRTANNDIKSCLRLDLIVSLLY